MHFARATYTHGMRRFLSKSLLYHEYHAENRDNNDCINGSSTVAISCTSSKCSDQWKSERTHIRCIVDIQLALSQSTRGCRLSVQEGCTPHVASVTMAVECLRSMVVGCSLRSLWEKSRSCRVNSLWPSNNDIWYITLMLVWHHIAACLGKSYRDFSLCMLCG